MGIDEIIRNFANSTSASIWVFIWALGELLGLITIGMQLRRIAKANSDPSKPEVSIGDIIPIMIIGSLMFNLKKTIEATWGSFSDSAVSYDPISYQPAQEIPFVSVGVDSALTLVACFGGLFFFKGLFLIKKGTIEGQASSFYSGDTISRGLTHMIGGAFLVNSPYVLNALYISISGS